MNKEQLQEKLLIESGYAGRNSENKLVDRRLVENAFAVPIQENCLTGAPKPKPTYKSPYSFSNF